MSGDSTAEMRLLERNVVYNNIIDCGVLVIWA